MTAKKVNNTPKKKKQQSYTVIFAKPSYFVIKQKDKNVVIREKNNYRRGETIIR